MGLPLVFMYVPTPDLEATLHWYRDVMGHDELWREGEDTVGLATPGSDIALMLDRVPDPDMGGPGPIFIAEDVKAHLAEHPDLKPVAEPMDIPDGTLASFQDPTGNWFYILDQKGAA